MTLREAINVEDLKARDLLVRRFRRIRTRLVRDKAEYEAWNRLHPDEPPIDTSLEDAGIAWCDGGEYPVDSIKRYLEETTGFSFGVKGG